MLISEVFNAFFSPSISFCYSQNLLLLTAEMLMDTRHSRHTVPRLSEESFGVNNAEGT